MLALIVLRLEPFLSGIFGLGVALDGGPVGVRELPRFGNIAESCQFLGNPSVGFRFRREGLENNGDLVAIRPLHAGDPAIWRGGVGHFSLWAERGKPYAHLPIPG